MLVEVRIYSKFPALPYGLYFLIMSPLVSLSVVKDGDSSIGIVHQVKHFISRK